MEITNIRHLFALHGRKVAAAALLLLALLNTTPIQGQFNVHEFDNQQKRMHFGILLGYNAADFRIGRSDAFAFSDSVRSVEALKGPGFTLGIISNLRLNRHFDLRLLPTMAFSERRLEYFEFQHEEPVLQRIESINFELPVLLKFKSNPYHDIRMYVVGGMKYSYDMASNAKARNAEDIVKINRHDLNIEYGLGMEIYFPMFILAPEIRLSQGIFDIHSPDPGLRYSNVLQRLFTRMITVTFNFEG